MTQQTIRTFRANLQLSGNRLENHMRVAINREGNRGLASASCSYRHEQHSLCLKLQKKPEGVARVRKAMEAIYAHLPNGALTESDFIDLMHNHQTGFYKDTELANAYDIPLVTVERFVKHYKVPMLSFPF